MIVSICIPIYNVSAYIERCARSLFEQTYKDIEYIFVDDCSPDDSVDRLERVIGEYKNRIDSVHIVHHEKNRGLAAARNTAVENAQGDFIMHVDSDDWLEPYAVEKLVNKQKETDADIVSGSAILHYDDQKKVLIAEEYPTKEDMILKMVELTLDHVLWRRLIRTSLYKDNNIQAVEGVNIGEDHYTLPKLIYYAQKLAVIDDVVYNYNHILHDSYMNYGDWKSFSTKIKSDILSVNNLIDFFLKKNGKIIHKLYMIKTQRGMKYLRMSFSKRDSVIYNYVASEFFAIDINYLKDYGFTSCLKIAVYRNYFCHYYYLRIRDYIKKFLKT